MATDSVRLRGRATIPIRKFSPPIPGQRKWIRRGDTIWYNGIPTTKAKARYVSDEGPGGVMIWSLDYDVPGERSLLSAIHEVLANDSVKWPCPVDLQSSVSLPQYPGRP